MKQLAKPLVLSGVALSLGTTPAYASFNGPFATTQLQQNGFIRTVLAQEFYAQEDAAETNAATVEEDTCLLAVGPIAPGILFEGDVNVDVGVSATTSLSYTSGLVDAAPAQDNDDEAMFLASEAVDDSELSEIRGGFITSSGMVIDVGLVTQTIVNGLVVENSSFSAEQLATISSQELQTLIQVNRSGGADIKKLGLDDIPQIITAIQNTSNNAEIHNFTILNVDVTNVAGFLQQVQTPIINFQNITANTR